MDEYLSQCAALASASSESPDSKQERGPFPESNQPKTLFCFQPSCIFPMKTFPAIFLSLATVMLALAQSPSAVECPVTKIIVDRAGPEIFPEIWLTEKISATAEPLSEEAQPRCREIVAKGLAKYPSAMVNANLKNVYVLAGLKYSGVSAAGTRSGSNIYVVSKPKYSAVQVEGIIHAEFSSVLLRNFSSYLDKIAWQQSNPSDFTYRNSGVQAIRDKQASLRSSDALYEDGFLNEYSKASIEEDFNSYAARLFMGDAAIWSAIEKYPKLKAKADLTIAFFGKIDATLNAEFFQTVRRNTTK